MASIVYFLKSLVIKSLTYAVRLLDLIYPKNNKLITIGAHDFSGNSYYFYSIQKEKNFLEYEIIWLTRSVDILSEIHSKWGTEAAYKSTSIRGIHNFLRSKTVVVDHGSSDVFYYIGKWNPRKYIVNLWHGIPIKRMMGFVKNAKMLWDVMPVSSKIEKALFQSYLVTSDLPILGMPRNQYLFTQGDIEKIKDRLTNFIDYKPSIIITYAPTYRHHIQTELFPFDDYSAEEIIEVLEKYNILIILRLHPNELGVENPKLHDLLLSKHVELGNRDRFPRMQELLVISDYLITDYSSNYYDFLIMRKPTIFFPYDRDDYQNRYGLVSFYKHISSQTSCNTQSDFIKLLIDLIENPTKLDSWLEKEFQSYHEYDPKKVVHNIIKYIDENK